ncbi:MAG: DUF1957 domain-containing protein [Planctomycetaceae bacterium]|nr:DUF1957 domain-containing protein [Planctomycetaceae bacterium]
MPKGYLAIVLHAHLPFVRHPEHDNFLEELWFYEAMAETYIPLIKILSRLEDDGVGYKMLLSLSPTLTSMMEDDLLQQRFSRHLGRVIRLADQEAKRVDTTPERRRLAVYYSDFYRDVLFWFEDKCHRRPTTVLADLAGLGNLDLMTCGATHGFLPILQQNPGAVRAQIVTARDHHKRVFGRRPDGIWLPECAYYPGVEDFLAEAGFSYTFVDTHGIENASAKPVRGVYAPLVDHRGIAYFGRDRETSYQVWSAEQGYPGHPNYREFYRDLGFELPEAELAEFVIDGHIRVNTGLKYNRITSRHGGEKALYDPDAAREQAARHAEHFLENRVRQVDRLAESLDGRPPLIVAPYDAELYGHWWFEGPQFLDYVLRKIHYDQDTVKCMTPAEYLHAWPENQLASPAGSSWGGDGTYEFWINDANQDIIPGLHKAADRLTHLVATLRAGGDFGESRHDALLKQMMRELMLAQSSDWPFIMRTGTSPDYARKRIRDHLQRFWTLDAMCADGGWDEKGFNAIRQADNIFPDCEPELYSPAAGK